MITLMPLLQKKNQEKKKNLEMRFYHYSTSVTTLLFLKLQEYVHFSLKNPKAELKNREIIFILV